MLKNVPVVTFLNSHKLMKFNKLMKNSIIFFSGDKTEQHYFIHSDIEDILWGHFTKLLLFIKQLFKQQELLKMSPKIFKY
jgi:hypothetical protein